MTAATVPSPRAVPPPIARAAVGVAVVQTIVVVAVASLASSRATDNALSPLATACLLAGAAMAGASLAWPSGLYAGAADVLAGRCELDCGPGCPAADGPDPWAVGTLWRRTAFVSMLAGVWALAAGGLVAVALDGRPASFPVLAMALAGTAGIAAVAVDTAGRHRGAHAALAAGRSTPVSLRRRAWRQIALPLAGFQAVVNAGAAWVLFHDRPVGDALVDGVLTRDVALADIVVVVLLVSVVFALVLGHQWGDVDARLGRVVLDDPIAQTVSAKTPVRAAGIVYLALAGLAGAEVVAWLLPATPSLGTVIVARGLYAGALVLVLAAAGYVRGAVNASDGAA